MNNQPTNKNTWVTQLVAFLVMVGPVLIWLAICAAIAVRAFHWIVY